MNNNIKLQIFHILAVFNPKPLVLSFHIFLFFIRTFSSYLLYFERGSGNPGLIRIMNVLIYRLHCIHAELLEI